MAGAQAVSYSLEHHGAVLRQSAWVAVTIKLRHYRHQHGQRSGGNDDINYTKRIHVASSSSPNITPAVSYTRVFSVSDRILRS